MVLSWCRPLSESSFRGLIGPSGCLLSLRTGAYLEAAPALSEALTKRMDVCRSSEGRDLLTLCHFWKADSTCPSDRRA